MSEQKLTGYPSIDKPWLKYYDQEAINAPLPECTLYENIWRHNREHLSDIALEYYGCKTTYDKMFGQVDACAKALKQYGISRGENIAVVMSGFPEAVYLVLAASKIGAVINFINPLFETEQKIDRINDTGARLLFVMDAMYSYIAEAIDRTCVKQIIVVPATGSFPAVMRGLAALKGKRDTVLKTAMRQENHTLWRSFIQSGEAYTDSTEDAYCKNAPVVMVYSSGTTGASKGIVLTNDGINATITQYESANIGIERGRVFLSIVPVWFSTGIIVCLLMPMCLGVKCVLEPVFGPEPFTKAMIRYKPNSTLAATSIWLDLIYKAKEKHIDLSNVWIPVTGGEQLLSQTEIMIDELLASCGAPEMQKGWGMCELGATAASTSHSHNKLGSVGFPLPLVTIAAFDTETDEERPYGKRGELRVLTPCHMMEYYKNPSATAEFFHKGKDGQLWACSGDMGYLDEDGDVFVLGRMSDNYMAISGAKIYLFDIENVILQDAAVEHCEVVDIDIAGEIAPVAHLVLEKTYVDKPSAISRIHTACVNALPPDAVPRAYKVRDSFAVKPSGKRDIESLKKERDGFVDAAGKKVQL